MREPQPTGAFQWTQEPWGRALRCRRLPVLHLFTSRDLILRDDEGEWRMVAASLGIPVERLRLPRQVHGTRVAIARRGSRDTWPRPEADIVLTDDPEVAVGVRVADCAPILLVDPQRSVAGAVHAGWRGTAMHVAMTAVSAMQAEFGCDPGQLIAAIGPCLRSCCGEVGPEVVDAFRSAGADADRIGRWFMPGRDDRSMLDLPGANRDQLEQAGVPPDAIFASGLCTKSGRAVFHSYRADGAAAGRLLAAVRALPATST